MKQPISPELIEKKLNRPKPRKFSRPSGATYPLTALSALKTILTILSQPLKSFRTLHDAALRDNGALVIDREYRERWSSSIADYAHWYYADKRLLHSISWLGVPTRKMLADLWVYQEIIHECRPDYILEIGSLFGGSALFMANVCDMIGHGKIISVDISRAIYGVSHPRITELTGDCASPEIIEQVRALVSDGTVMVIHDADHNRTAVMRDLSNYAGLVTPGQYLIVEDGIVDLFNPERSRLAKAYPDGGPLPAADQFAKQHAELFEIDMNRERFLLTSNPRGYLRRKYPSGTR
ncbi:CmcI family methyltransferase [Methyloversatilis thermotolerans]|uniref:CmcI family methyltransferase n=1 Tax=Methyloversatilis thermotolerans TaxID=1346290 RepID=UPI0003746FD7|nr:CmcI family methyltransferase [Methyloversatilis thermotolerans]